MLTAQLTLLIKRDGSKIKIYSLVANLLNNTLKGNESFHWTRVRTCKVITPVAVLL